MCRGQLPVWQRDWPELRTPGAGFVSVAADADLEQAQGFAAAHDFPTLVDAGNALARALGYRAIPNGYVFDRDGVLRDEKITGFDLLRNSAATRELVRWWLGTGPRVAPTTRPLVDDANGEALALFAEGQAFRERRDARAGLARWHAAFLRDPKSFVIRKQIWRALYPERFREPIDTAWQREQIAREDALGFGVANPDLPAAEDARSARS